MVVVGGGNVSMYIYIKYPYEMIVGGNVLENGVTKELRGWSWQKRSLASSLQTWQPSRENPDGYTISHSSSSNSSKGFVGRGATTREKETKKRRKIKEEREGGILSYPRRHIIRLNCAMAIRVKSFSTYDMRVKCMLCITKKLRVGEEGWRTAKKL